MNKATAKDKKKKKKTSKKATVNNGEDSKKESDAEFGEEISEDDSLRKHNPQKGIQRTARSAGICYTEYYTEYPYRNLNEHINNLKEDERKGFAESYIAYRARADRNDDTTVMKSMVYSKMQ